MVKAKAVEGTWYFANSRDGRVKVLVPAVNLEHIAKNAGYDLKDLKIWEANWNGREFIKGKLVKGFD